MGMRDIDRQTDDTSPCRGWILYDGQCGFCHRWVLLWRKTVERRGFGVKDLQSAHAQGSLQVPQENLLDDIRVVTPDGGCVTGADAYLLVARRIWWAWPFYAIFSLPGFHGLLWRGYRLINRNRYHLSRHCPMPREAGAARLPKKDA
jgi:predicted DCC family thiol-disulfide oxidoreductase YuxK